MKKNHLNNVGKDVTIIGNFGVTVGSINPQFQQTGWWYEYFSGDSLFVNDVNANISLDAGEYRLYSNQKLVTSTTQPEFSDFGINLFPNPANGQFTVNLDIENTAMLKVDLYDISGKPLAQLYHAPYAKGQNLVFEPDQQNGIYFLRFVADQQIAFKKLIIHN